MSTDALDRGLALLEETGVKFAGLEPVTDTHVQECERRWGVVFPPSYRAFLLRLGVLARDDITIFGLGVPQFLLPGVECAIRVTRAMHPDAPPGMVPVSLLETGVFACLDCSPERAGGSEPPVVRWDLRLPTAEQPWEALADSFGEYLFRLAFDRQAAQTALARLREHIAEFDRRFNYEHKGEGKLPRNHDWRPYRFSSQDIVLGAHVQRHVKGENALEVDVFLPIDAPPFEPGSSLLALTINILADAYRCGGTMEIRFTENVDGGLFPRKLQALAEALGEPVKPESIARRRLDPDDSRRLFLALTDFSPAVRARLAQMSTTPERACYAVQRGIWPKPEAEALILSYRQADRVFDGGAPPEQRLLFQQDVLHARAAILAGYLDRALALRERELGDRETLELEDDTRQVETAFDPATFAQIYRVFPAAGESEADCLVPWLAEGLTQPDKVPFREPFVVLARARPAEELSRALGEDMAEAAKIGQATGRIVFVLVPQDYYHPSLEEARAAWLKRARDSGVGILVCAQTVEGLEEEAAQRFAACRIIRE